MTSVLNAIHVLEIGSDLGAWCGKLLADMGATVTKIEPLSGDPMRSYPPFYKDIPNKNSSLYFWHYNTNKRSVTLDLDMEEGRELFRRLISKTDVVIDSLPPGQLTNYDLGYTSLSKINSAIILASLSPFGQSLPYSDYQATDLTALAFGGSAWSCGYDDHELPPVRCGGNQAYHTVSHFAAMGIMTALIHRQFSGEGQFIDVNMHAAQNVTTEGGAYNWLIAQETVQRQTGRHASVAPTPPTQIKCRDDKYVNIGFPARTEEQWFQLLAWLDDHDLVGNLSDYLTPPNREAIVRRDPDAIKHMHLVMQAVEKLCQTSNAKDIFAKAQELGFQWGVVYAPDEAMEDEHFLARNMRIEVSHPEQERFFAYPGSPYKFELTPWNIKRRPPLLGEDNDTVYAQELGIDSTNLTELKSQDVI